MARKSQEEGMAKCIPKNESEGRGTMEDVITREKRLLRITESVFAWPQPGFTVGRQERREAGRSKQNPRSKDLPALLRIQTFPLKAVGSPLQGFCWGTWPDSTSTCFRKTILTTTSKQVEQESEGRRRQGGPSSGRGAMAEVG